MSITTAFYIMAGVIAFACLLPVFVTLFLGDE
ncbi:hypothetical protein PJM41_0012 [Salmonella phage vB_SenS_UTK0009]|uniref:Uncharacterized protein n=2 Tax=Epseptimavirus TaxID=2732017 RepID=A0AAF0CHG6_9CAUD|nr:hypothetical protein [Salmonella phage GSW6]WDR22097.1 hypothetical protein PJM41_0012 [Salmonella phage vB_SenS_UTK0009]